MKKSGNIQTFDLENQSDSQGNDAISIRIEEDKQDVINKIENYVKFYSNTLKSIKNNTNTKLSQQEKSHSSSSQNGEQTSQKSYNGTINSDNIIIQDPQPISNRYDIPDCLNQQNESQYQNFNILVSNQQGMKGVSIQELIQDISKEIVDKKVNYDHLTTKNIDDARKSSGISRTLTKSTTIFDDEYFCEDNEKQSAKKMRYMNPELFYKLRDHQVEWCFPVFFEFLGYHIIFYYLLGPLTIIPFIKSEKLMRNLSFWGNQAQFYIQSVLYFLNAFNMILYFTSDNTHIFTVEIVYMEVVLLLRAYIIACKYATLHPDKIELYRNYVLLGDLTLNDYYFARWIFQSDITIYRESYNAFQRGEFDSSMFYMSFFINPNQECLNEIEDGIQQLKKWHKQDQEFQTSCIYPQEDSIYGYGIIRYLITQFTKKNPNAPLLVSAIILALMRGFLLLIYRYLSKDEANLEFTTIEIVQMVGIIYNTSFGYFSSFIFLIFFTKDLQMKNYFQKQCILLLSPKKINVGVQKILPTINFTDPFSLKTWSTLRRVLLDYGRAYYIRLEAFISVYIFVAIFSLVVLLLWLFEVYKLPTNIGVACGFEAFFIFFFLFYILIQGAIINSSFDINKNIILDYEMIFDDIIRLRKFYFHGSKPSNMIRKKIISKLQKKLGLNDQFDEVQEQKVLLYIQDILDGFKDCQKELEQDSVNQPFLFFGIKITKVLVQNVLVGLGTSAIGIIQYYLSIKQ